MAKATAPPLPLGFTLSSPLQLLANGQHLAGESLVDFDEIEVIHVHAVRFSSFCSPGRADPHDRRVYADSRWRGARWPALQPFSFAPSFDIISVIVAPSVRGRHSPQSRARLGRYEGFSALILQRCVFARVLVGVHGLF